MKCKKKKTYEFGKNWYKFIKRKFNVERVEIAKNWILDFLELDNLNGKYFLDVGCGSGIHSLAALLAGSLKIVSFDVDQDSVAITKKLKEWAGNPEHWTVLQGSVLDKDFLDTLEPADVVYSWGVLHHTGNMWKALENTIRLMNQNALLYIALYDYNAHINPSPEFWLEVKYRYNTKPSYMKRMLELWYIWNFNLYHNPLNLPHLIKKILNYKKDRGMAFYTNIKDWLGGWPMEFAKPSEVKKFCEENFKLELVKIKTGEANAEYLFK